MPPARRSTTTKSTARKPAARATSAVRARASSTKAATRREVEQSITRFEKRLDDANDALQTLGTHLGRGAQSSYKEVTAALRALRRDAAKTNKQALKDFDKLRAAVTPGKSRATAGASRSTNARATSAGSATKARASSSRSSGGASRSTNARATSARSTSARSTSARSTSARSRAKKS
jgi:hypothetical protein